MLRKHCDRSRAETEEQQEEEQEEQEEQEAVEPAVPVLACHHHLPPCRLSTCLELEVPRRLPRRRACWHLLHPHRQELWEEQEEPPHQPTCPRCLTS